MNTNEIIEQIDKSIASYRLAIEESEKFKAELLATKRDDWWTERGFDKEPQPGEWVKVWDNNSGFAIMSKFDCFERHRSHPFTTEYGRFKNISPAVLPREKLGLWVAVDMDGLKYLYMTEPLIPRGGEKFKSTLIAIQIKNLHTLDKLTAHLKLGEKMEV